MFKTYYKKLDAQNTIVITLCVMSMITCVATLVMQIIHDMKENENEKPISYTNGETSVA